MPTPLDRALQSRNAFLGFAGIITAVAAWTIWGPSDVFPRAGDPVGDPESWTDDELRRWLEARKLYPGIIMIPGNAVDDEIEVSVGGSAVKLTSDTDPLGSFQRNPAADLAFLRNVPTILLAGSSVCENGDVRRTITLGLVALHGIGAEPEGTAGSG
ncbi:hypothetical protein B0A49_00899 [Cryomyces minteri]|uniref:Uncharacterized protein n=1 Tax=Cryomyces minteri TaxID=331657 RepID=A0A4V5NGU0_9PEZI|nr:hypothetical protein B0A49_01665 [Cryomyces minteri]TKA79806.1 hypothetical protein B0A49_00899 [Cryomyces minteri]